jgi:hypothetical protein
MNAEHTSLIEQSNLISLRNPSIQWAQLERGKLDVGFRLVEAAPLVVSSRTTNLAVQVEAELHPGRTAVVMFDSLQPGNRWFGHELDAASVALCRDQMDLQLTGSSTVSAIVIDHQLLEANFPNSLDAFDLAEGLKRSGVSRGTPNAAQLRHRCRHALRGDRARCLSDRSGAHDGRDRA